MRISSWNFVRVPKANVISGIVYFRDIILESSWNLSETTPWWCVCMHQWIGSLLAELMAWRLFGATSSSEPMPNKCQLGLVNTKRRYRRSFETLYSSKTYCRLVNRGPYAIVQYPIPSQTVTFQDAFVSEENYRPNCSLKANEGYRRLVEISDKGHSYHHILRSLEGTRMVFIASQSLLNLTCV